MNTVIATNYVTATDSFPATVPPTTSPYRLGMSSAQLGELCVPELWFGTRHDQREFCRGWKDYAKATGGEVKQ